MLVSIIHDKTLTGNYSWEFGIKLALRYLGMAFYYAANVEAKR